ncbi:LacI family DNA-binding transcriptional regulator [Rhodobacteraceae bacterium CCMM004]|nr:LacI family DNA-binding transcriptional regulator [Rhodobacteraceae bacterium CCMM004]
MNLRQLAEKLGLSQTTVSRALNGYPEVSEATRRRVQDAARLHNYTPNSWAKGLATGRSNAIAHVIPVNSTHEMVNPVFADFLAGAGEVYSAAGYDMLLSVVAAEEEERLYRSFGARHNVDGLLVHAPLRDDPRVPLLKEIGLPFVVHGRATEGSGDYSWLDMDNRRAFRRATQFLIDLGHTRIALINGLDGMDFAIRRHAGYAEALDSAGLAAADCCRWGEMTEQYGYETAADLLDGPDAPTAFLVSSLITAIGIRRACEERDLSLARDVSIVSHDDDLSYFRNGRSDPYFTSLRSPVREHGRRAAAMLLRLIETPEEGPLQELLEAELRLGQSTGRAPPPPPRAVRQG